MKLPTPRAALLACFVIVAAVFGFRLHEVAVQAEKFAAKDAEVHQRFDRNGIYYCDGNGKRIPKWEAAERFGPELWTQDERDALVAHEDSVDVADSLQRAALKDKKEGG